MSSAPFERAFTSLAIHSKLIAADSGAALTCANTSFFGCACAKAGARPVARMPAMPAEAVSSVRRVNLVRVMGVLPIAEMMFVLRVVPAVRWQQDTECRRPHQWLCGPRLARRNGQPQPG